MERRYLLLLIAIFVVVWPIMVSASPSVQVSEALVNGQYQYSFSLLTEDGDLAFELYLDLPLDPGKVISVSAPAGWGSTIDPFAAGFLSWGDNGSGRIFIESIADFGFDSIGPTCLRGFLLTSSVRLSGAIYYSANFDSLSQQGRSMPMSSIFLLLLE